MALYSIAAMVSLGALNRDLALNYVHTNTSTHTTHPISIITLAYHNTHGFEFGYMHSFEYVYTHMHEVVQLPKIHCHLILI